MALILSPALVSAATESHWAPVKTSLSQFLFELRYWFGELMSSSSFQVLLVGVAVICTIIWAVYSYEASRATREKQNTVDRTVWRSTRGRRHVIRQYFGVHRRATT